MLDSVFKCFQTHHLTRSTAPALMRLTNKIELVITSFSSDCQRVDTDRQVLTRPGMPESDIRANIWGRDYRGRPDCNIIK